MRNNKITKRVLLIVVLSMFFHHYPLKHTLQKLNTKSKIITHINMQKQLLMIGPIKEKSLMPTISTVGT